MSRELTKEQFLSELWCLQDSGNNIGNPDSVYKYLVSNFIEKDIYLLDNTLITFELLRDKYKKYCTWWTISYGHIQKQYIGQNKKIDINTFLVKSMYNQSFEMEVKKRDYYLFGSKSLQQLKESCNVFIAEVSGRTIKQETINKPF